MPNDPKFVMSTLTTSVTDPTIQVPPAQNQSTTAVYLTATPNFIDAYGNTILYYLANPTTNNPWPSVPPGSAPSSGYHFIPSDNNSTWDISGYNSVWNDSATGCTSGTRMLLSTPLFGSSGNPGTLATPNVAALGTAQYLLIGAGPDGRYCQVSPLVNDDIIVWGP
jgi:hypothetical protein